MSNPGDLVASLLILICGYSDELLESGTPWLKITRWVKLPGDVVQASEFL